MSLECSQGMKVMGVGVDASDDPWTLQLKLAALNAQEKGLESLHVDPYDMIVPELLRLCDGVEPVGKLPVPSWLSPRPKVSDAHLISKDHMGLFVSKGGMLKLANKVKRFTQEKVAPGYPIMLGVDHSATGGVISALSEALGPKNLAVLVLDQHFDGLPLSLRLDSAFQRHSSGAPFLHDTAYDNTYCCGNFWKHLIENRIVLPQNLFFIGVADYPDEKTPPQWRRFRESYLEFEAQGCHFFPLKAFEGAYIDDLKEFIEKKIRAPQLYVSLDLDVGAYRCVHAARYMDRVGINREALMNVARITARNCRSGRFQLVGMDVMEFNIHFLRLETKDGMKDETVSIALDFIKELIG